jgi:hypothetical protein
MRYRPATQLPADILAPQRQRHQQPEPGARPYVPLAAPPPLLAENARTLDRHAGPCARCGHALLGGERVADIASNGKAAHLSCVSAAASAQ